MTLLQSGGGSLPPTSPHDSILVVQTPQGFRLPSGPSSLTRALFDRPQEVQWAALSAGVLVFAALAFLALRYRAEILRWVTTRSRAVTLALATVATAGVVAFGMVGWSGWQLMEHDNAFCTSCHLMHAPIARFYQTKHRGVECHDCHKQSMFADMRELQLWVFERPAKVPAHENVVPNPICEGCHLQGQLPKGIEASDPRVKEAHKIDRTVGHMVHLRSSRQPGIECSQCHARPTMHVFKPSNATCQQGGCHDDIKIKLAKMQGVQLECTQCHDFMRPVGTVKAPFTPQEKNLLPLRDQCVSCHKMQERLKTQRFTADPHREQCGLCHNMHRQTDAKATVAACSSGGCHTRVDTLSSFHVGLPAKALAHCDECHTPHTWKARGKVCADCHTTPPSPSGAPAVPGRRAQLAPDLPRSEGTGR